MGEGMVMKESRPQTPIFVLEGHDLGIYGSVQHAEDHLEPIDVREGIYDGWDAWGRRLGITSDGKDTLIALAEEEPTDFSRLETELRAHLKRLGEDKALDSRCDLPCLVELARRHTLRR